MIARRSIALASGLLLAGCNMAPHYVRPAMPVPAHLPQGPAYAPDGGTSTVPTASAWHDFFIDDRLRQLIAQALADNRDLRIAVANVAQARAQFRVQHADLFPTVGLGGTATYERIPPGLSGVTGATDSGTSGSGAGSVATGASRYNIYEASVGVSTWEVDLFGRLRNLTEAAQEQYFASQANRDAAQTALIAELVTNWLTMAADQDRLQIAEDTAKAFGETLNITRGRAG